MKHILRNISFIMFFALSSIINLWSQDEDVLKQSFNRAESFVKQNKYADALPLYQQVQAGGVDHANLNYRIGLCYMNMLGQERYALSFLEKGSKEIAEDYKGSDWRNTGAAPEVLLLLGDAYHRNENLEQASVSYHKYRSYVVYDEKQLQEVNSRIMALGISQGEVRDHARDVALTNLGAQINSKASDYNIVFSGDEKTRVFTRYDKRQDIIYASYFKDGSWSEPENIGEQVGSEGNMYATALSYNGTELYLVMLTAYDADLYVSTFDGSKWQYAENLGKNVNSKYIESNATVSADGQTLYFSSDRALSKGGFDIFYSQREGNDWSKAKNLGEAINTKANEESPHITNNGQTLYFSSDRKGSIGRMDIYYSRLEGESWGAPENLGMPYNSVEDDISFKYYEKYRKGYVARDLPGGLGKLDLYLIQSGSDRQRELQDYMASLRPAEPQVTEEDVVVDTVRPVSEPIVVDVPEKEPVIAVVEHVEKTPVPVVAVPAGEAVAVEEEKEIEKEEPIVVEVVEKTPVVEEEIIPVKEVVVPVVKIPEPVAAKQVKDGEYTVQILALIFPKRQIDFRGLDQLLVEEIPGTDGYTRYLYGRYDSEKEARKALRQVFSNDFSDAFIRLTSEINNL